MRGQKHAPDCPERAVKQHYLRWNRGLLRTMPDAPAGYVWELEMHQPVGSCLNLNGKVLAEVAGRFAQNPWWQRFGTGCVIARCVQRTGRDQIVDWFQVAEIRTVWKKAAIKV